MDHRHHHNEAVGEGGAANSISLQKNVTFHLVEGSIGHNTAYFSYPTLPNSKSTFRLCGRFWSFKYFFEQPTTVSTPSKTQNLHQHSGTKIESDACQINCYLSRTHDHSDVELQLYCDSGSKANIGGWTLGQMKWVSISVSFVNPETKQILSQKKVEGETRCGKLLCHCRQNKLCLRKANFCSVDYLQSFYTINKCTKPRHGMSATYYSSLDAFVTVTLFPQNPKSPVTTSVQDLYWKSQQVASKRIFHAKIGTDFKLESNGIELPCHKCILAGHSEVFSKMFTSETKKQPQHHLPPSSVTKLVMENMSVVGVESFLKYLYYGDTAFSKLGASVALELFMAAEKYSIPHLRTTSIEILLSKNPDDFDCGTALNMYLLAVKNNSHSQYSTLRRMALHCFSKNYVELVKSEVFVKLFVENRERAQEILIKIHTNTNKKV